MYYEYKYAVNSNYYSPFSASRPNPVNHDPVNSIATESSKSLLMNKLKFKENIDINILIDNFWTFI